MALEDINPGTRYCWYDAAYDNGGKLEGPFIDETANDFAIVGVEATGKVNTENMIRSWNSSQYGAQNNHSSYDDVWGVIQNEVSNGWFVPSKSEWAAFGATFDITRNNYSITFGLSRSYLSSSQNTTKQIYNVVYYNGNISRVAVDSNSCYVRLGTNF